MCVALWKPVSDYEIFQTSVNLGWVWLLKDQNFYSKMKCVFFNINGHIGSSAVNIRIKWWRNCEQKHKAALSRRIIQTKNTKNSNFCRSRYFNDAGKTDLHVQHSVGTLSFLQFLTLNLNSDVWRSILSSWNFTVDFCKHSQTWLSADWQLYFYFIYPEFGNLCCRGDLAQTAASTKQHKIRRQMKQ